MVSSIVTADRVGVAVAARRRTSASADKTRASMPSASLRSTRGSVSAAREGCVDAWRVGGVRARGHVIWGRAVGRARGAGRAHVARLE